MYRLGGVAVDVETVDETLVLPLQGLAPDAIDLIAAEAEGQGATVTMDEPSASGVLAITHPRKRVVVESIAGARHRMRQRSPSLSGLLWRWISRVTTPSRRMECISALRLKSTRMPNDSRACCWQRQPWAKETGLEIGEPH
jgi:hypothetical protein